MLELFWRFLAEGNAHQVYRYVGPPNENFSGMVLKLPKNTNLRNQYRLLKQHRFVKKNVTGCDFLPFEVLDSASLSRTARRFSHSETMRVHVCNHVLASPSLGFQRTTTPQQGKKRKIKTKVSSVNETYPRRLRQDLHPFISSGNLIFFPLGLLIYESILLSSYLIRWFHHLGLNIFLKENRKLLLLYNIMYSQNPHKSNPEQGLSQNSINVRLNRTKGLINGIHIPFQKLHHLDNLHILNLENRNVYQTLPLVLDNPHSISITLCNFPRRTSDAERSPKDCFSEVYIVSGEWQKGQDLHSLHSLSHEHSSIGNGDKPFKRLLDQQNRFTSFLDSTQPLNSKDIHESKLQTSSYALLEKDLITPPIPLFKLLGFHSSASFVFPSTLKQNSLLDTKWVYLTCEIKPKTGLPIIVRDFGATIQPKQIPCRFTLQQHLKLMQCEIMKRSFYDPCKFFETLGDPMGLLQQFQFLQLEPQNNFHLFINGVRMLWSDDQRKKEEKTKKRQLAFNMNANHLSSHTSPNIRKIFVPKDSEHLSISTPNRIEDIQCQDNYIMGLKDWINTIDIGSDAKQQKTILSPIFEMFSRIVHRERNLFYRLLYMHAFCEGQQEYANALLDYLIKESGFDLEEEHDKGETVGHRLNNSKAASVTPSLHNLFNEDFITQALHDFVPSINDVIMAELNAEVKNRGSVKRWASLSTEMNIAQRIQFSHYSLGERLLQAFHNSENLHTFQERKTLHKNAIFWIYRYLVGRTFLDCSIMLNLAISIGEKNENEFHRRFIKLVDFSLDDILRTQENVSDEESEEAILKSCVQRLTVFSPHGFLHKTKHGDPDNSCDTEYFLSDKHQWVDVLALIKHVYNLSDPADTEASTQQDSKALKRRDPTSLTLSLWYRVSLVDLDLKEASKIPGWAKQFRDILNLQQVSELLCNNTPTLLEKKKTY